MTGRLWRVVVAVVLVLGWLFVHSPPASACSCASLTEEDALESADVVFSASLVEIRTPAGEAWSSTDPERFIFEVDRVYKGEARVRQSVVTARDGSSCGLELAGEGPFLVFAQRDPDGLASGTAGAGELHANLCGGSRTLTPESTRSFGAGEPPSVGTSPIGSAGESDTPVGWYAAAVAAATALGGVTGLVAWRRRAQAAARPR
jgi:hypothetical protein